VKQLIRKIKTVETLKFRVHTTQQDISDGECRLATKCMEKVAIARTLQKHLNLSDDETRRLHVRVDAGHVTFNHAGSKWQADTPRVAKDALIKFDIGKHHVRPHSYTVSATKKGKVRPMTEERQKQIRVARAKRVREGRPDRPYSDRVTLRHRIVGFA
jgi:hypothetical protein